VKIQSDNGNNDQPLERELFGTTPSPNLLNRKTLSTQQPIIVGVMMNMNPFIAIIHVNVLPIQLLKYHDNDDPVLHIVPTFLLKNFSSFPFHPFVLCTTVKYG